MEPFGVLMDPKMDIGLVISLWSDCQAASAAVDPSEAPMARMVLEVVIAGCDQIMRQRKDEVDDFAWNLRNGV